MVSITYFTRVFVKRRNSMPFQANYFATEVNVRMKLDISEG